MSWMISTRATRLVYPAIVLACAAAIGGYAAWSGGRMAVAFLVLATLALGWIVWLAFRAAQALVHDAPAVDAGAVVTGKRRKELEREKQALLKALKELDFDHQMGKVSDKDFADISATYRARAIRVMRQLDDAGRDYETMIAADVAKKVATDGAAASGGAVASAPAAEPDKCAHCGTRNDSDAEFCKKCGGKLIKEASSSARSKEAS
jgi:ribosomal protein L40E